jgi:transcriptional regulator with XRE-family HTH domain
VNLKTIRKTKGFTQAEAAHLLGVSERAWRRWENTGINIPSSLLLQIQEVFSLSDSETLGLIKPKTKEPNQ